MNHGLRFLLSAGTFLFALSSLLLAADRPTSQPTSEPSTQATGIKIVLVGDSTVNDEGGWGIEFKRDLKPGITCVNWAKNGRSSKSFINEKLWDKALAEKPNFVLIQFGHNDQPGKPEDRRTDASTTYQDYLRKYVNDSRAIGAMPILVTSMTRRRFDADGKIKSDLWDYVNAMKKVAAEEKVPLVDLHQRSIDVLNQMGPKASEPLDPAPNKRSAESTTTQSAKADKTHLSPMGQEMMGRLVVDELQKVLPESKAWFK